MLSKKVLNHLDKNKIKYEKILHKTVYTAFDLANTLKKKLSEIAKTLLVKADKKYVLVVLPAHYRLDLAKVKKALKAKKVELAPEKMMTKLFKVKPGQITPFGTLHKIETWVDKNLLKTEKAILQAGSFTESLRLKVKDLVKLEGAKLAQLAAAGKKKK